MDRIHPMKWLDTLTEEGLAIFGWGFFIGALFHAEVVLAVHPFRWWFWPILLVAQAGGLWRVARNLSRMVDKSQLLDMMMSDALTTTKQAVEASRHSMEIGAASIEKAQQLLDRAENHLQVTQSLADDLRDAVTSVHQEVSRGAAQGEVNL